MQADGDPAAPRFVADEPRVVEAPFGRLDEDHPLRRAIRRIPYPARAERVLSHVRADPGVEPDQVAWLETVLPDRTFESEAHIADAIGAWGPPPPTTPRSL